MYTGLWFIYTKSYTNSYTVDVALMWAFMSPADVTRRMIPNDMNWMIREWRQMIRERCQIIRIEWNENNERITSNNTEMTINDMRMISNDTRMMPNDIYENGIKWYELNDTNWWQWYKNNTKW